MAREQPRKLNVGDKVYFVLVGPGVTTREETTVAKVKGKWCWYEGSGLDKEWNCYDRVTGAAKENNIPGFTSRLERR